MVYDKMECLMIGGRTWGAVLSQGFVNILL